MDRTITVWFCKKYNLISLGDYETKEFDALLRTIVVCLQELHLLLLKTREELITAKVAKEHIEDTLKSEIMFLKDRVSTPRLMRMCTYLQGHGTDSDLMGVLDSCGAW